MEFLSDAKAAGFGRFVGELSRADLERFFYLDDADRDLIAKRRGITVGWGSRYSLGRPVFWGRPLRIRWTFRGARLVTLLRSSAFWTLLW
ncbi:hypothetical protein ABIB14_003293 [Arthrobacter sp. UYEF3]